VSRARFWLRWSARDLRARWVLVLAIALVIAIGTGIYSGLGSMENWRIASNDASFAALRAHDLEVSLTEGTFAPEGRLHRLVRSIPDGEALAGVEERLVLPTQAAIERPGARPLLVSAQLVGSRLGPDGPAIDGVAADAGRGLEPGDTRRRVSVLEASFAEYHDLPATGSLRLGGGAPIRYVGQGRSPEYFLVTRPGGGEFGGAESGFAVVFTSLHTARTAVAGRPVVNDVVVRLAAGADEDAVGAQLRASLERSGLTGTVTSQRDETAYRILYKDAEGDQQLFNIFPR
jgi:putative ABC transport system permease protein